MAGLIVILFNCFKDMFKPDNGPSGSNEETNPGWRILHTRKNLCIMCFNNNKFVDQIVREILANENPVENISKWADKNLDKLDKCLVIQNGQWFAEGELDIANFTFWRDITHFLYMSFIDVMTYRANWHTP